MTENHSINDVIWVLSCGFLVMLMQAGFCCLETGLVRAKNSINVAIKNFIDFCISSATFFAFGFAIMFGASWCGLFGTSGCLFSGSTDPWRIAFFFDLYTDAAAAGRSYPLITPIGRNRATFFDRPAL